MSLLKVTDLKVSYGGIEALKGVSFQVKKGQIVTLIGANGAGKSTILRAISRLVSIKSGAINFDGRDITSLDTASIVGQGVVLVPEGRRVFPNLTVFENLKIGAYLRTNQKEVEDSIEYVYQRFPKLKERHWQLAGTLSGGEQQMLAVGRALMARPKLLMMDEPSLGLAPLVVREIFDIIRRLQQEGITILLIEQNANTALRTSQYAYVLETGRIIMEGPGIELLHNPQIRDAYLGQSRRK